MQAKKFAQLKAHSGALYALAPGREANTLFSAGADKVVAEWNLETLTTNPFAIRTQHTVYSLLNLNHKQLVIGTIVGGMHVIDLSSRQEIRHLKLHDKGVFHLIEIPQSKQVIASCADGSISVWNTKDWSLERHLFLSSEKVRRTAVSEKGDLIAVASGDGFVRILETGSFKIIHEMEAHQDGANSVAFLTNNDLITGGKDAHLCHWSAQNGFELTERIPAHNYAVYDIIAREAFIATASRDKTVKIWNPSDLSTPIRLDRAKAGGHINSVNAAIWLEKEKLLATCSDDRTVILWEILT